MSKDKQIIEIKECLRLLVTAVERVTVNTYIEQGSLGADSVFSILEKVEKIIGKEPTKSEDTE